MTPAQCRAARGLLNITQPKLAELAAVGVSTIKNFETEKTAPYRNNLAAIRTALERKGIDFIDENGGGAGLRLAKPGKAKRK